jgi:hypothetical protein
MTRQRLTAANSVEHIAQCRTCSRCDNADGLRKIGKLALAFGVKETFGFQHGFETQKFLKERAFAFGLDETGNKLVLPLRLVNGDASMHFDRRTFLKIWAGAHDVSLPHDAFQ